MEKYYDGGMKGKVDVTIREDVAIKLLSLVSLFDISLSDFLMGIVESAYEAIEEENSKITTSDLDV